MNATFHEIRPETSANGFRIMSYNVLADSLTSSERFPSSGESLDFNYRFNAIKQELHHYQPDLLLLQEVDVIHKIEWKQLFKELDMFQEYMRGPKKLHGIMIAWSSRFQFEQKYTVYLDGKHSRFSTGCVGLVIKLRLKNSQERFLVSTAHLFWHPQAEYDRVFQLTTLLECMFNAWNYDKNMHFILGGDFNALPSTPTANCLPDGKITGMYERQLLRSAALSLFDGVAGNKPLSFNRLESPRDAVKSLVKRFNDLEDLVVQLIDPYDELSRIPDFTNWASDFEGTLDYIYVSERFIIKGVLDIPYELPFPGLPNENQHGGYPSDHLPLIADIELPRTLQLNWWIH